MIRYVAGFLFNEIDGKSFEVLLVRKAVGPKYLHGFWNAIGGKIEDDETINQAMKREFQEETGIEASLDWVYYCNLSAKDFQVFFFKAFIKQIPAHLSITPDTGEIVKRWRLDEIRVSPNALVPNLSWLIPMALDSHDITATVQEGK